MAALNKSITETLTEHHSELDVKKLKDGKNTVRHKNGADYVAEVKKGQLVRLTAVNADGKETGTVVKIEPPVSPQPDHYLLCICDPDLGDGCWWVPYPGEEGEWHRAW